MDWPVPKDFPFTRNWLWTIRRRSLWWLRGTLLLMSSLFWKRGHQRAPNNSCRSKVPLLPGLGDEKESRKLSKRERPSHMSWMFLKKKEGWDGGWHLHPWEKGIWIGWESRSYKQPDLHHPICFCEMQRKRKLRKGMALFCVCSVGLMVNKMDSWFMTPKSVFQNYSSLLPDTAFFFLICVSVIDIDLLMYLLLTSTHSFMLSYWSVGVYTGTLLICEQYCFPRSRFGTHVDWGSIAKCYHHSVKCSFTAAVTFLK